MGEREEPYEGALAILVDAGMRSGAGTIADDAARRFADAGWRPPHLRPHASRCQLDKDHEGDCTWPEPEAAKPLFEGCIEDLGWEEPLEQQGRSRPSVTVVAVDGADVHPLTYGQSVDVAVYRKGDVPGPVRPRPKSDPERLRDLFDDTAGVRASVDQCRVLLDTGLALLPEPKVRWTVDGYDVLDDEADVAVAASCSNRALAERIARLLNEEDERG